MSEQIKILLVDDEPDILDFMRYNLEKEGYKIFTASNGRDAIDIAAAEIPDLIILDVMMPVMDGMEACRILRENKMLDRSAIAFLTARNEDYSQIAGLDVGADDYIGKPIKPRILLSRIKALLRRSERGQKDQSISSGSINLDPERYEVTSEGRSLNLPRKEFELLALLLSKPGKVFTREEIMSRVWGNDIIVGDRTIDVHIRKIREKIGEQTIKTIKGIGYKFND